MSDNKTLKPCPFCGEMPHLEQDYDFGYYAVYCGNAECAILPFTNAYDTESEAIEAWNRRIITDKIDYEKVAVYYSKKYKQTVERNRQLIDDIEKSDSDYFKLKKNRDEWKGAFYKSVEEFKKLCDICDKLITAREMLTEEVNDLKDELKSMDYDFMDSREGYENDIDSLEVENEKLKNALESTEKELNDYQESCESLTKENERLKNLCKLCGSY